MAAKEVRRGQGIRQLQLSCISFPAFTMAGIVKNSSAILLVICGAINALLSKIGKLLAAYIHIKVELI